jgi:hypothetical protein
VPACVQSLIGTPAHAEFRKECEKNWPERFRLQRPPPVTPSAMQLAKFALRQEQNKEQRDVFGEESAAAAASDPRIAVPASISTREERPLKRQRGSKQEAGRP